MLKHPHLTDRRIERFLDNEIRPALWSRQVPMSATIYQPDTAGPRPTDHVSPGLAEPCPKDATFVSIMPGHVWGPIWSDAWFHLGGTIPAEWAGEIVVARIDCGCESIVWDSE